jgi:hypothetical protein
MSFIKNNNRPTVEIFNWDEDLLWDNTEPLKVDTKKYQQDYVTFLGIVEFIHHKNPNWRKGQTIFNCLYNLYPDFANEIRATELDPFYIDDRIPQTLEYVYNKLTRSSAEEKLPTDQGKNSRTSGTGGDNESIPRARSNQEEGQKSTENG